MPVHDWDALDRAELLAAIRSLDGDLRRLRVSYDLALERNACLENELYAFNADLQLGMLATEEQLRTAREENKRVQQHLVMSERLAKLGELVAGMTHELNNPLGVAVTAASFEQDCVPRLRALLVGLGSGRLPSAEELLAIGQELDGLEESSGLILSNLSRSAEIVNSFKEMAVDQSSDRAREFQLEDIIRQTINSLKPQLRGKGCAVETEFQAPASMHSYPGTISQIITNLAINSLNHGFEGRCGGIIRISTKACAELSGGGVLLRFEDNGAGIPAAVLPDIFKEFFTTRAQSGGSGLGLSIVRNLVTQRLKGTIGCSSVPAAAGQPGSTVFELRLPLRAAD